MDIWQYFDQKREQFERWGVTIEPDRRSKGPFRAEPYSDDSRGFVSVRLGLTEDVYVSVFEHVEVRGSAVACLAYSYNLIVNKGPEYRWHLDPKNHPDDPLHEHEGPNIRHTGTRPASLDDVLERAWEEANLQREAPIED